jgi:hypothetical protein
VCCISGGFIRDDHISDDHIKTEDLSPRVEGTERVYTTEAVKRPATMMVFAFTEKPDIFR